MSLLLLLGAVASLWLLVTIVRGDVALCPLCVVVHGANLLAVALWIWSRGAERGAEWRALLGEARDTTGRTAEGRIAARWRLVGLLFVLLAAATAYQRLLLETRERELAGAELSPQAILRAFLTAPRRDLALDGNEAFLGAADARLELVVFGDAWCPHCRDLWRSAPDLVERYPDLRIVFRHFPLEKSCNLGVAATIHPGACEAALGLEAARRQARFWPYYEALSRIPPAERGGAPQRAAREADLALERFETDLSAPGTRERVQRDVALGRSLVLDGVPVLFLDGRRVPDPPLAALPLLLDHLLEPAGRGAR